MTALENALAAAELGWHVIPCRREDKRPYTRNGLKDATTDPDKIRRWWGKLPVALPGIVAGPSGLAIADLDRKGGKDGPATLERLGHPLPATWRQDTPSGGVHAFYRAPADVAMPNGAADMFEPGSGIDRRSGESYAILYTAPPTSLDELAPSPDWLVVGDGRSAGTATDRAPDADVEAFRARLSPGKPDKALRAEIRAIEFPAGAAHEPMLEVVARLVGLGVRGERGVAKLLDETEARYIGTGGPDRPRDWDLALAGSIRRQGLPLVTWEMTEAERQAIADREEPVAPSVTPVALAEAHDTFRAWLGLGYDLGALNAVLATAACNNLNGDPPWLWLVSGSGAAKTETVAPLAAAGATVVSAIASEGALLSATSRGERSADATGGLLREIGERGILVLKDGTSMLSMDRGARSQVFAALREVHDGSWTRNVGTDGGRSLEWTGRLVVIGAVTTAWDRVHADTISAFGDRFVLVRMDSNSGRVAAGRKAISNTGSEESMRAELGAAVAGVLAGADYTGVEPDDNEADALLAAADLVTLTRTAVDVDYRGNVVDAHAPEMPTRFAKQLAQIFRGGVAIGLDRTEALALAIRVARDSLPPIRLEILEDIAAHPWTPLREVVKRVDKPRSTVDRQLQALHLLGLLTVDEEVNVAAFSQRETTTWRYTLADGINVAAVADPTEPSTPLPTKGTKE